MCSYFILNLVFVNIPEVFTGSQHKNEAGTMSHRVQEFGLWSWSSTGPGLYQLSLGEVKVEEETQVYRSGLSNVNALVLEKKEECCRHLDLSLTLGTEGAPLKSGS